MFVEKISRIFTPQVRSYIYGVCLAVVPLLSAYGVYDESLTPKILGVVMSVLGFGTAFAHRPTNNTNNTDNTLNNNNNNSNGSGEGVMFDNVHVVD